MTVLLTKIRKDGDFLKKSAPVGRSISVLARASRSPILAKQQCRRRVWSTPWSLPLVLMGYGVPCGTSLHT